MRNTERRVQDIEENTMSSSGSSCSSVGKRKKKNDIPNTVKVTFYGMLCAYSVHCNYGFSRGKLNVYITC